MSDTHSEYYVCTDGNDDNPGTREKPFCSIERAKAAARENKSLTVINIGSGTYRQEKPIVFTHEDSNTAYRAMEGGEVIISGGRNISGPWQREGNLLYTDLEKPLPYYFKNLYVGMEERQRARTPNPDPEQPNQVLYRNGRIEDAPKNAFRFREGDIRRFKNLHDVMINYYQMWVSSPCWITEVDEENNIVYFEGETLFSSLEFPLFVNPRGRYYLENALEFLDSPGEWYLDSGLGRLYYYPLDGEDPLNLTVTAPSMSKLIILRGSPGEPVENLSFDGLKFVHTDWNAENRNDTDRQAHEMLGDGVIYAEFASGCKWENCELTLGGSHGIFLDKGCRDNVVSRCHIHALGGGGVYIGPHGWKVNYISPAGEEVERNVVDNCFIHDLSHFFHGSCNVWIGCAGYNRISHCELSDNDYCGVLVGWSWTVSEPSPHHHNIVEANHIHHLGHGEISDFGGIYTLGNSPGTEIRDNVVHHVFAHGKSWGIYLDEGSRWITVKRNLVYKTNDRSFLDKNGPNSIQENIFAYPGNNVLDTYKDSHGGATFDFTANIVITATPAGKVRDLINRWHIKKVRFDNNVYWDISNNELFLFDRKVFEKWQGEGYDVHSLIADPEFAAAVPEKTEHFTVSASSPARKLGYDSDPENPIGFSKAGLYGDDVWTMLPGEYSPRYLHALYDKMDIRDT